MKIHTVIKEVKYDHVHLKEGDKVQQIDEWRTNQEGYNISLFKLHTGEVIPLLFDEVKVMVKRLQDKGELK